MTIPKATQSLAFFCVALVSQSVAEIDDEGRVDFAQAKPRSGFNRRILISCSGKKSEVKVTVFELLLNYLHALNLAAPVLPSPPSLSSLFGHHSWSSRIGFRVDYPILNRL